MRRNFISVVVVFLAFGFAAQPLHAQVGRGAFGFGLNVGGNMLQSDWKTDNPGFGASADVSYSLKSNWGLASSLGVDQFRGVNKLNQNVASTIFRASIAVSYEFLRDKPVNPFIFAGAGWMLYTPRVVGGGALFNGQYPPYDVLAFGGVGIDYYVNESWSVIVKAEAGMMGTDAADGYVTGSNDTFARVSIGIRYYLFDRSTVERIVDTVTKR